MAKWVAAFFILAFVGILGWVVLKMEEPIL